MAVRPWYKRFSADFIHGSIGLSLEEKGAYSLCLDLIYEHGGPIPDDPRWLAGVCGISTAKWLALRARLIERGKLVIRPDGLSNPRAEREIASVEQLYRKKSAARTGAGRGDLMGVGVNEISELTDRTSDHHERLEEKEKEKEKETREEIETGSLRSPRAAGADAAISASGTGEPGTGRARGERWRPVDELGAVLDAERAAAIVEHRKRLRKPLTAHAARLLAEKFAASADPGAAADAMIANGWAGFEPSWLAGRAGRQRGPPAAPPANGFLALHRRLTDAADDQPADPEPDNQSGATLDLRPTGPARS